MLYALKLLYIFMIAILLFPNQAFAQDEEILLSEDDWNTLIPYLANEKWEEAEKITLKYLDRYKKVQNTENNAQVAILRYMYIKCVGALLGDKKYNKEEVINKLEGFEGKTVITPFRTFNSKCMFNCVKLSDDGDSFFSTSSNNIATVIHTFETYQMEDKEVLKDVEKLEKKSIRLGGFIKTIKAEGFTMPRLEITFEKAFIWEKDE